ncbi:MAG: DUF1015 domain-containing protein [Acidimicrobiia bacterium]|nr:DUF1015 domain-containing protein [Acidimicrobiia bacterium]
MPRFEPFRAIRYDLGTNDPAAVTAPPYDVIDAPGRDALCRRSTFNVVNVDLPVPESGAATDPYVAAAERLARWHRDGVVVTDDVPSFTVYRMERIDEDGHVRQTTGVLGAMDLSRPGEGDILPHEFTTPKARSDRLDLLRATRTNLSAVWGLSPARGLSELLAIDDDPLCRFEVDGVTHIVWRVTDPDRIAAISASVAAHPIVIADGHHRYETSLSYRDERRAADGTAGAADAVLTFVVELVDDELHVGPIHRLLTGLPDQPELLVALDGFFAIEPVADPAALTVFSLQQQGALALVRGDGAWWLRPRPEAMEGVADLDSSRLDHALSAIGGCTVRYQHGIEHVRAAVASGDAEAGVLLRPVTVAQIVAIADGGERMPPKSTFFEPKPLTGLVFRSLD